MEFSWEIRKTMKIVTVQPLTKEGNFEKIHQEEEEKEHVCPECLFTQKYPKWYWFGLPENCSEVLETMKISLSFPLEEADIYN